MSPANFCDLPLEIFPEILKNLDLPRRLIVRKVSKTFRGIVDALEPNYNYIGITLDPEFMELDLEGYKIKYTQKKKGKALRSKTTVMKELLNDFLSIVSNPKMKLKCLKLVFIESAYTGFGVFWDFYKLHVRFKLNVHHFHVQFYDIPPENSSIDESLNYDTLKKLETDFITVWKGNIMEMKKNIFTILLYPKYSRVNRIGYFIKGNEDDLREDPTELLNAPTPRIPANGIRRSQQPIQKNVVARTTGREIQKSWNPYFSKHNSLH